MITFTVLMVAVLALLVLFRGRIEWGQFLLGVACAYLALGTFVGQPVLQFVQSTADAGQAAINQLLTSAFH